MPVYESKRITRDGRKYYFSCYYTDKYGTRKKYMSKMYLGKRECEKAERSFLEETTFRRYLNKYVKLAKIKPKSPNYKEGDSILTPHGFRHSHASLLVNLGLDFKDVAERLGDTPKMVESTYYHMFPQKKSNTVNALNNLNK